jgi:hypothetical protein
MSNPRRMRRPVCALASQPAVWAWQAGGGRMPARCWLQQPQRCVACTACTARPQHACLNVAATSARTSSSLMASKASISCGTAVRTGKRAVQGRCPQYGRPPGTPYKCAATQRKQRESKLKAQQGVPGVYREGRRGGSRGEACGRQRRTCGRTQEQSTPPTPSACRLAKVYRPRSGRRKCGCCGQNTCGRSRWGHWGGCGAVCVCEKGPSKPGQHRSHQDRQRGS